MQEPQSKRSTTALKHAIHSLTTALLYIHKSIARSSTSCLYHTIQLPDLARSDVQRNILKSCASYAGVLALHAPALLLARLLGEVLGVHVACKIASAGGDGALEKRDLSGYVGLTLYCDGGCWEAGWCVR